MLFQKKKNEKIDINMERDLKGLRFESRNGIREVVSCRGRLHLFDGFSLRHFDFILLLLVLALNIIGIYAIGSAEPELRLRQIYGTILSMTVMAVISTLDYHRFMKYHWLWYLVCLTLLTAVKLFGSTANEAQRWIAIGGLRFQPSESAKILLILFYASLITRLQDKMKTFPAVLLLILLALPPIALVYLQPDLSTSIMIFIIICVMMFVGGLSWKLVTGALIISVPAGIIVFNLILQEGQTLVNTYQRGRVLAWLHPEQYKDTLAYQTMNSMMAIGSGQLLGKGYNTNEISSLLNSGYISESQTDFIFTVIGEETGFIGTTAVVLLLVLVSVRCMLIALQAKDVSGSLIAAGAGAWIGFQGIINIGVVTGVLPNTGLPLPFVSYGLTSLLCLYAGIGFVLNVRMQSKKR